MGGGYAAGLVNTLAGGGSMIEPTSIGIGRDRIKVFAERDPTQLPWGDLGIDVVLECTGIFTKREQAELHLKAGARRVLISAPAAGADLTVVYGVNDMKLRKSMRVVSNASCTTNCLAPVAAVLNAKIGIVEGFMTTIHAYTGDQPVHDTLHGDLRRARAAAMSMIPTSTGAARAARRGRLRQVVALATTQPPLRKRTTTSWATSHRQPQPCTPTALPSWRRAAPIIKNKTTATPRLRTSRTKFSPASWVRSALTTLRPCATSTRACLTGPCARATATRGLCRH